MIAPAAPAELARKAARPRDAYPEPPANAAASHPTARAS
jgi:hypothetical protein